MLGINKKKSTYLGTSAVVALLTVFSPVIAGLNASAADLSKFNAGNIISDEEMSNYASMSEEEIQDFLTSKNPCANTDYELYQHLSSRGGNYTWHWEDNHFVCLSEELFGDGETIGSGDTAAQIIWQAAQDYHINPQVLISLIEREQGLITDDYPSNISYRLATGFGCSKSTACDSRYYGFRNQIRHTAESFRNVLDEGKAIYSVGENYIAYNADSVCGGSNVYIENKATSALYSHNSPYQPNRAALDAGYGAGDSCSSYSIRNFYLYYNDWFKNSIEETWADLEKMQIKVDLNDIPNQTYVIGTHIFTRDKNLPTYPGYITTKSIMLAARTIEGDDLDDMKIYYKTTRGIWVDGTTNLPIEQPEFF